MVTEKHTCEEPGCNKEGSQCHLVNYGNYKSKPVDVFKYYCKEHAIKNGYCWLCGEFFQATCGPDLCPNCRDEVDAEVVEVDPEEASWFDE